MKKLLFCLLIIHGLVLAANARAAEDDESQLFVLADGSQVVGEIVIDSGEHIMVRDPLTGKSRTIQRKNIVSVGPVPENLTPTKSTELGLAVYTLSDGEQRIGVVVFDFGTQIMIRDPLTGDEFSFKRSEILSVSNAPVDIDAARPTSLRFDSQRYPDSGVLVVGDSLDIRFAGVVQPCVIMQLTPPPNCILVAGPGVSEKPTSTGISVPVYFAGMGLDNDASAKIQTLDSNIETAVEIVSSINQRGIYALLKDETVLELEIAPRIIGGAVKFSIQTEQGAPRAKIRYGWVEKIAMSEIDLQNHTNGFDMNEFHETGSLRVQNSIEKLVDGASGVGVVLSIHVPEESTLLVAPGVVATSFEHVAEIPVYFNGFGLDKYANGTILGRSNNPNAVPEIIRRINERGLFVLQNDGRVMKLEIAPRTLNGAVVLPPNQSVKTEATRRPKASRRGGSGNGRINNQESSSEGANALVNESNEAEVLFRWIEQPHLAEHDVWKHAIDPIFSNYESTAKASLLLVEQGRDQIRKINRSISGGIPIRHSRCDGKGYLKPNQRSIFTLQEEKEYQRLLSNAMSSAGNGMTTVAIRITCSLCENGVERYREVNPEYLSALRTHIGIVEKGVAATSSLVDKIVRLRDELHSDQAEKWETEDWMVWFNKKPEWTPDLVELNEDFAKSDARLSKLKP